MGFVVRAWKDPVGSKVIATVIVAAGAGIATWLWAHYQSDVIAAWHWASSEISVTPLRALAIVFGAFAAGAAWMRLFMWDKADTQSQAGSSLPVTAPNPLGPSAHDRYTGDVLFGFRWRWKIAAKTGEVYGIKMYCPECDYEIQSTAFDYPYDGGVDCMCENCGYSKNIGSIEPALFMNKVKLEAERKFRTGEWERVDQQY